MSTQDIPRPAIQRALRTLTRSLPYGYKLTLIARLPSKTGAEIIISDDSMARVAEVVNKHIKERPSVPHD